MISTTIDSMIRLFFIILILHLMIRFIRYFYKFPIPAFLVNLIDNPIRRKIQPPLEMSFRHGIQPGMTALEVGPGNGIFTVETARQIGKTGRVITVDIMPKIIKRLKNRAFTENLINIEGIIADVHHLPFNGGAFDIVYMIAVIGEIPNPENAISEFYRILSPKGLLAFSELLFDPDYPLGKTLEKWAGQANFRVKHKQGNLIVYTLVFEKGEI